MMVSPTMICYKSGNCDITGYCDESSLRDRIVPLLAVTSLGGSIFAFGSSAVDVCLLTIMLTSVSVLPHPLFKQFHTPLLCYENVTSSC